MESLKRRWKNLHTGIRKPIVLAAGLLFIIAAGLTGWLPGPGGIPLFLIGIAILATEFDWAKQLRDMVVNWIEQAGKQFRAHKVAGSVILVLGIAIAGSLSIVVYRILR